MTNLNPNDFVLIPHVAVVDEFRMSDSSGGMVTLVDSKFLALLAAQMNEREIKTGDLSPLVIGHTNDDLGENHQPQIVGFARNWNVDPFFETGRQAAFADFWLYNTVDLLIDGQKLTLVAAEIVKRWPRRSAEVWTDRHEIDPISLLGATTPARDLGLLKLSRNGSFTYISPGETQVNPQSPAVDAAVAGQSSPMEKMQSQLDQLTAMVQKLVDSAPPAIDPAATAGAPPDAAGAGADGQISDDELAQLLGASGGAGAPAGAPPTPEDDESRAGQKPVQNGTGYPGGSNTAITDPQVKLSELEVKLADTTRELNRIKLSRTLEKVRAQGYDVDPEDAELISDLAAQPEDMRARSLARFIKLARKSPTKDSFNLESAVAHSTTGAAGKRIGSVEEQAKVIKLARDKGITFEAAAEQSGYTV